MLSLRLRLCSLLPRSSCLWAPLFPCLVFPPPSAALRAGKKAFPWFQVEGKAAFPIHQRQGWVMSLACPTVAHLPSPLLWLHSTLPIPPTHPALQPFCLPALGGHSLCSLTGLPFGGIPQERPLSHCVFSNTKSASKPQPTCVPLTEVWANRSTVCRLFLFFFCTKGTIGSRASAWRHEDGCAFVTLEHPLSPA